LSRPEGSVRATAAELESESEPKKAPI
jgi:hypothetical protein